MLEGINGVIARKTDEIYLEVRVSNESAVRMYERLGFQIKSRLRAYYRDGGRRMPYGSRIRVNDRAIAIPRRLEGM